MICLLLVTLFPLPSSSQPTTSFHPSSNCGFIENKGQVVDQNYNPNPNVLYLLNTPGMNVQLRMGGFSYDLYTRQVAQGTIHEKRKSNNEQRISNNEQRIKTDGRKSLLPFWGACLPVRQGAGGGVAFHRIDFDLIGANPDCEIIPTEPSFEYLNFYTAGTPAEGITNIRSYQKVIYKNIYPSIDMEFLTDDGSGFKYNFIVYPGGKLSSIKMKILDPEIEVNSSGFLVLTNTISSITEEIPESHILSNGVKIPLKARFRKTGENEYGIFSGSPVPASSTIIIDPTPTRVWGTYYGGAGEEWCHGIDIDSAGNIYISGHTMSSSNIATAGAYQATLMGIENSYLAKFSSSGQLLYGTYYGGYCADIGDQCTLDPFGNIYMCGTWTCSPTNIATPGAYQTVLNGGIDGFLVKFSTNGYRIWGTYFGGSQNDDWVEGVCCDKTGNVFICGRTNSTDSIATPGSYQSSYNGGSSDAFLGKFDSSGQIQWCTYFGGPGGEFGYACETDTIGNVYFSGLTGSASNIATTGSFQSSPGGMTDGFLASFNTDGQIKWSTYYGGSADDGAYWCDISPTGMIYITGFAESMDNIATPGAYQTIPFSDEDAFLAKFDPQGMRQWGTYFGGDSTEVGWEVCINDSNYIYLTGYTHSSVNIATAGAFKTNYSGGFNGDAFLTRFDSTGQRIWSTYYGSSGSDYGGRGCKSFGPDAIYMIGITNSTDSISTPGAHQVQFGGGANLGDAFLVKFIYCLLPDSAGPITGPTDVCKNSSGINYSVTPIANATGYIWIVPPGFSITGGQNTNNITVTATASAATGIISVKGTNYCGSGDSSVISVTVHERPIITLTGCDTVCTGQSCLYSTSPGKSLYQWNISSGGIITGGGTSTSDTATVIWTTSGFQWISVNYTDTNGCAGLYAIQEDVWVIPSGPQVSVTITPSVNPVCEGTPVIFTAIPTNGGTNPSFQWKVNASNAGMNNAVFTYVPTNGDLVSCVLTSNEQCTTHNPATSNVIPMTVNLNLPVSITISASGNPVCTGTIVLFTANAVNQGNDPVYQWKVNGLNVGTNGPSYSFIPVNNDIVTCTLTSSEPCTSGNPATSAPVIMTVNQLLTVSVNISASSNPFCIGSSVIFTALPTNQGSSPVYQWKVNGANAGTNSPAFSYNPFNNDSVLCIMASNLACVSGNPASSNTIIMSGILASVVTFTACFDTITSVNAKPIKLKGGIPLNGAYSGPGVSSGIFNPAAAGIGIKIITYTYTNAGLCSASKTKIIVVQSAPLFVCGNNLTDIRDGKTYPTLQLGSQCWMAANLNYGNPVSGIQHQRDNCIPEKYCYNNLPEPCALSSALYQWDELMQYEDAEGIQGLCPPGWHVPSESDWQTLFANWTNNAFAGAPLKYSGYSGFNALLSGTGFFNRGWYFSDFATFFWSSTSQGPFKAWAHAMNDFDFSVSYYPSYRVNAFSVRCLKD